MSISARIPITDMAAANASLEAAGFGGRNFSVPVYTNRAEPTHAVLHAWGNNLTDFYTAVKALPNVEWSEIEGTPKERTEAALSGINGQWGGNAPELSGVVTPGLHRDAEGGLWWVIQQYDTAIWPDPSAPGLLALVRRARIPGDVAEWKQPTDQFDGYYRTNPFTGRPDRALRNGDVWYVYKVNAGAVNTFAPETWGWANEAGVAAAQEWANNTDYALKSYVTYLGIPYLCISAHRSQGNFKPDTTASLWESVQV